MTKAKSRAERFDEAISKVADIKTDIEELRDELENWLDNMPENLQSGSKAMELEDAIGELDSVISSLEDAESCAPSFPGMR